MIQAVYLFIILETDLYNVVGTGTRLRLEDTGFEIK